MTDAPRRPALVAHWPREMPVDTHPAFSPLPRHLPLAGTLTPERAPDPPVTSRAGEAFRLVGVILVVAAVCIAGAAGALFGFMLDAGWFAPHG